MTEELAVPEGCTYYKPEALKAEHRADGSESLCLLVAVMSGMAADHRGSIEEVSQMITCPYPSAQLHENGFDAVKADSEDTVRMDVEIVRIYDGISQSVHDRANEKGTLDAHGMKQEEYLQRLDDHFVKPEHIRQS